MTRQSLPKVIAGLVVVGVVATACLVSYVRSFIFAPYPAGNWQPLISDLRDAWFSADDGVKLHGWYLKHKSPRAVLLYAHGAAGNLTTRASTIVRLNEQLNLSVLVFDYRGYGRSEGVPSERGLYRDARAARAWLANAEHVAEHEIFLLGHSLGTAVMVDLATNDGARGLVLWSGFTSKSDFLVDFGWWRWVPAWLLEDYELNSSAKIKKYRSPLLVVHGDADPVYALGKRLFDIANEPKRLVTVRGGGHDYHGDELFEALDKFVGNFH